MNSNQILPATILENIYSLTIRDGCFQNLEDDSNKKRSKQWGAIVSRNSTAPGGFHRSFLKRADNGFLELNENLLPGRYIELSDGQKSRGYYKILSQSDSELVIEEVRKDQVTPDESVSVPRGNESY